MSLSINHAELSLKSQMPSSGLDIPLHHEFRTQQGMQAPHLQKLGNSGADSFINQLKTAIKDVDQAQKASDVAAVDVATGHNKNIHEAMILMEKADIALRTMVTVRNKVLDAYKEIMNMQV